MLRDATVSRLHATLRNVDGAWWLRDEGSTNGTWINGRRVAGTVEVQPGDELLLGHARLVLA
jgi:pSer/pThr/pTyr-binding forkhead associated (FHA) protein